MEIQFKAGSLIHGVACHSWSCAACSTHTFSHLAHHKASRGNLLGGCRSIVARVTKSASHRSVSVTTIGSDVSSGRARLVASRSEATSGSACGSVSQTLSNYASIASCLISHLLDLEAEVDGLFIIVFTLNFETVVFSFKVFTSVNKVRLFLTPFCTFAFVS